MSNTGTRLARLEDAAIESRLEERLEQEFYEFFELLEERLDYNTFMRVMGVSALGDRPSA
jgi:hypothetical protein